MGLKKTYLEIYGNTATNFYRGDPFYSILSYSNWVLPISPRIPDFSS